MSEFTALHVMQAPSNSDSGTRTLKILPLQLRFLVFCKSKRKAKKTVALKLYNLRGYNGHILSLKQLKSSGFYNFFLLFCLPRVNFFPRNMIRFFCRLRKSWAEILKSVKKRDGKIFRSYYDGMFSYTWKYEKFFLLRSTEKNIFYASLQRSAG